MQSQTTNVSPTSIRSRILKESDLGVGGAYEEVSPTSIRSRILKDFLESTLRALTIRFTHVDPFEDTESRKCGNDEYSSKVVSPTSIRSRILKEREHNRDRHDDA